MTNFQSVYLHDGVQSSISTNGYFGSRNIIIYCGRDDHNWNTEFSIVFTLLDKIVRCVQGLQYFAKTFLNSYIWQYMLEIPTAKTYFVATHNTQSFDIEFFQHLSNFGKHRLVWNDSFRSQKRSSFLNPSVHVTPTQMFKLQQKESKKFKHSKILNKCIF